LNRALPRLVAITDANVLAGTALISHAQQLAHSGAAGSIAFLLRDHDVSASARLELGEQLRRVTRAAGQQLWVADRIDLALLLDADGLHLGEGSVRASDARLLFGAKGSVSRAWHRPRVTEQDLPELEGVDALVLSPIFQPRKGRAALGPTALRALARSLAAVGSPARVYALGGVTAPDVATCDHEGATGVAAIGTALGPDSLSLVRALGIERC
jgi:thiamine-phosphate pyrophosphorylase